MTDKGVGIRWENLSLFVDEKVSFRTYREKQILKGISGEVKPGKILAILGPSGAGKSSLLTALSSNGGGDRISGKIFLNGRQATTAALKKISAYVYQDSVFFSHLTVREVLRYTADLRLPQSMSSAKKEEIVDDVIRRLDLGKCQKTIVGNETAKGISGGERKRLSIATEIIHQPKIIFLDEPTTGLDSASALMVAKVLKDLAINGCSVVCTIHQPRSSILSMFDQIMILAEGSTVFCGTFDESIAFFAENDFPCPSYENPADYYLDIVNTKDELRNESRDSKVIEEGESPFVDKFESKSGEKLTRREIVDKLVTAFAKRSEEHKKSRANSLAVEPDLFHEEDDSTRTRNSWFHQSWVLFKRSFWYKFREPNAVMTQMSTAIIISLLVGSIYWRMGFSQEAIRDRFAALSFLITTLAFTAYDVILLFHLERAMYTREHNLGLYSTSAFFVGRTGAETPFHIIIGTIVALVAYFMCGFQATVTKFFIFYAFVVVSCLAGTGLLLLLSAITKDPASANIASTVILILLMLFNGFYINLKNVIVIYSWIDKVNFLYYSTSAVVTNEFTGLNFNCTPAEKDLTGNCPVSTGENALKIFGIGEISLWQNMVILIAIALGLRILAYLGLKFFFTGKKSIFGRIFGKKLVDENQRETKVKSQYEFSE